MKVTYKRTKLTSLHWQEAVVRFPYYGSVARIEDSRRFMFVRGSRREDVFAHNSANLGVSVDKIPLSFMGNDCLFSLGTTPGNDKISAVSWILVSDIDWQDRSRCISEEAWANLRKDYLSGLNAKRLSKIFSAQWYLDIWQSEKSGPPRNLSDPLLIDCLEKFESDSKKDRLKLDQSLLITPYAIPKILRPAREDMLLAGHSLLELIKDPDIDITDFSVVSDEHKRKFLEWFLIVAMSRGEQEDFSRLDVLSWKQPFESELATDLVDHEKLTSGVAGLWLKGLMSRGKLAEDFVNLRLRNYPEDEEFLVSSLSVQQQLSYFMLHGRDLDALNVAQKDGGNVFFSQYLHGRTLAVDIESDGEEIRQIGVSNGQDNRIIFDRDEDGNSFAEAIAELLTLVSNSFLVVGHNLLAWDWPILCKHNPELSKHVLLWDTLLIQFLLKPSSGGFALGGTHQAGDDAYDAWCLFRGQLDNLGLDLIGVLCSGKVNSTSLMYTNIASASTSSKIIYPERPKWLDSFGVNKLEEGLVIYADRSRIDSVRWLKDFVVTQLAGKDVLEIDSEHFTKKIQRDAVRSPAEIILSSVVETAAAHNIQVVEDMIPVWFGNTVAETGIALKDLTKIATAQARNFEVRTFDASKEAYEGNEYVVVSGVVEALSTHMKRLPFKRLPTSVREKLGGVPPNRDVLLRANDNNLGAYSSEWVKFDSVAHRLGDDGHHWRAYSVLGLNQTQTVVVPEERLPSRSVRQITSGEMAAFPGEEDQLTYWLDVIGKFLFGAISDDSEDTAWLLVVTSTQSATVIEILCNALISLRQATPKQEFWSVERWLEVGVSSGKNMFACLESDLGKWLGCAARKDITIVPVIEALPLDLWWSLTPSLQTVLTKHDPSADIPDGYHDTESSMVEDVDDEEAAVASTGQPLFEVTSKEVVSCSEKLLAINYPAWLDATGVAAIPKMIHLEPRINILGIESLESATPEVFSFAGLSEFTADDLKRSLVGLLGIERESVSSDFEPLENFLQDHWGSGFRFKEDTQRPVLEQVRTRQQDVMVPLPTGEGKSVLFQVPALYRGLRNRRLTLVLSPLKALMRDQVENLRDRGFDISVDYLSGDRPSHELDEVYRGIIDHRLCLVYAAPERLRNQRFTEALLRRSRADGGLEYIVLDEAHCVSQWGYEFRPDYLFALQRIKSLFRGPAVQDKTPLLFLSATVTGSTRKDIERLIQEREGEEPYLPFKVSPKPYTNPIRKHILLDPKLTPGILRGQNPSDWRISDRLKIIINCCEQAIEASNATGSQSAVIVFVSRRIQAEEIAFMISRQLLSVDVEFFHAGLDADSREDVYERYKAGEIAVLVATKAFGMGMDIPHIHWAVHLSPPQYLEDYLQEVGRIGRGEEDRARLQRHTGVDELKAIVLHSSDDFETNLENIQDNRIDFPEITTLYREIRELGKPVGDEIITVMPDAGFDCKLSGSRRRMQATRIRKTLFWLERVGYLEILGVFHQLLPLVLNVSALRGISVNSSGEELRSLAKGLLVLCADDVSNSTTQPMPKPAAKKEVVTKKPGLLRQLVGVLSSAIGFLLPTSTVVHPNSGNRASALSVSSPKVANSVEVIVNLENIWKQGLFRHPDDLISSLSELQRMNGLEIVRKIGFSSSRFSKLSPDFVDGLFSWYEEAMCCICGEMRAEVPSILDLDKLEIVCPQLEIEGKEIDLKPTLERAMKRSLLRIGVTVNDRINDEGVRYSQLVVRSSNRSRLIEKSKKLVDLTRVVYQEVKIALRADDPSVEFFRLVNASMQVNRRYRRRDLENSLALLASLKLCSASEPPISPSYIIETKLDNSTLDFDEFPDVVSELTRVNRFAELRGEAMEIFCHLPSSELRTDFIDGYFSINEPQELQEYLEAQLPLTDPGGSSRMEDKLETIRSVAIDELYERYKRPDAEEPNQWKAVEAGYEQHVLVNAGPGSGKTSVLLSRIVHLIHEQRLKPQEILVLAFNRAVVFEIRSRLKKIFSQVGYGAYVRRVKVYTFHGFALSYLSRDLDYQRSADQNHLVLFQQWLQNEQNVATVASELKSILVDEFQDMNDTLYDIVRTMQVSSGAGLFAIGDDDQDILRWNRSDNMLAANEYFSRFYSDYGAGNYLSTTLRINFRSGRAIVDRSQNMIAQFFDGHNTSRLKAVEALSACRGASEGDVLTPKKDELKGAVRDWVLARLPSELEAAVSSGESLAILCTTNAEVVEVYSDISRRFPGLKVQSSQDYPLSDLRGYAAWMDACEAIQSQYGDDPLQEVMFGKCYEAWCDSGVPEALLGESSRELAQSLWQLTLREYSYPHLSHHLELLEQIKFSELTRMLGTKNNEPELVISTIHKVKGLEYDRVVIVPSMSGIVVKNDTIEARSADEARLFYVAMTRAKSRLLFGFGGRERAWWKKIEYAGSPKGGRILMGSPEEVYISWAAKNRNLGNKVQEYIKNNVKKGDTINVQGRQLLHSYKNRQQQVGSLSKDFEIGRGELRVAEICRYFQDSEGRYFEGLVDDVKIKGWSYVVLVEGTL